MHDLKHRLQEQLRKLDTQGLLRSIVPVQPLDRGRIQVGPQKHLNLSGNDYLGLAGSRGLLREFYTGLTDDGWPGRYGTGSGASRLMTGSHEQYQQLEEALARLYAKDRALVFNSGFQLNIGILPALTNKGDVVLADKLCHASLIDGLRLSPARVIRYPHLAYDRLEDLLRQHSSQPQQQNSSLFIVSESIFSMDGDCADLQTLVRLKEQYGAVLYVDEAHAVGVRGSKGLGLAEEQGVAGQIDLLIGTFGKAWAGQGAFVVCNQIIHDFLVNTARSLIFSTGLPPVSIHWLNFILPRISGMTEERQHLVKLADRLRSGLREQGLSTDGESHIVPVLIGEAARAVAVAGRLRQQGFWVHAVRPPTVPLGTARLRLSVTAAMSEEQLTGLPELIAGALQG